eukprot:6819086-Alexandrium_andersonii.AAC.1
MTKAASWITTTQRVLRGTRSRSDFGAVLEDVDSLARIIASAEARSPGSTGRSEQGVAVAA